MMQMAVLYTGCAGRAVGPPAPVSGVFGEPTGVI